MSSTRNLPTIRGRTIGILFLTVIQLLVGIIHVFFGFWLMTATAATSLTNTQENPQIYNAYTLTFGILVLIFTYGIWQSKNWGWNGTVATSLFVVLVDSFTLLNLPSISGIPKTAAATEIIHSLLILAYLLQTHVRAKFKPAERKP
jgi:uncharacterized membrane protein (DUF2068 family)